MPGQPATEPDAQLADWRRHAGRTAATLASAYPASRLQRQAEDWAGRTVAVRGFALSFFDVVRVLTQGLGGRFSERGYQPSGREPACILPFSLDGQPPAPKPETRDVDRRFDPEDAETDAFRAAIAAAMGHPADQACSDVSAALIPPLHRILDAHGVTVAHQDLRDWLQSEWTSPGSQDGTDPVTALRDGIAMAEGRLAPSIGFAVGQLWRKWQNPLRQTFNPAPAATVETAASLVTFDEGLKRYSYGPPVAACREVLALIEAGIVSVDFSRDPDITPCETGWALRAEGAQVTAAVIVDAVLPSPDPQKLTDPLLTSLMRQGWLTTRDSLAGRTTEDGRLLDTDDRPAPGLALLGRLATGSVIAADSLHDCFGMASRRWADGVIARLV
ncbi:MAG: hypothetical protein GYB53_12595 [Rhodobacteraceae bacterium]|nr:hypothetical protein [Paracoccaceae bacterium]